MARRVRRDLTNKKIREVVKDKINDKDHLKHRSTTISNPNYFKPLFFLLLLVVVTTVSYNLIDSNPFDQFFSTEQTEANNTSSTNEGTGELAGETEQQSTNNSQKEESKPILKPVEHKTQIEILNGCGADGIAMATTKYSRQNELDVVYMGNYKNFEVQKSMVIDRIGDIETARKIADVLGIEHEMIKTKIEKSKQLDASVILGKDYKSLKPFKN